MKNISLDEFIREWTGGLNKRSQLDFNINEFTKIAGERSKLFFQSSFSYGGFFASGRRWKPRQSRWGKKFKHPVLIDSASLSKGISGKYSDKTRKLSRGKGYILKSSYDISTNERDKTYRTEKRGAGTGYLNYAAVHNSDPNVSGLTVNGKSSKKPVQRQFIGYSFRLNADIRKYIPLLFKGFPNAEG